MPLIANPGTGRMAGERALEAPGTRQTVRKGVGAAGWRRTMAEYGPRVASGRVIRGMSADSQSGEIGRTEHALVPASDDCGGGRILAERLRR